MVLKIEQGRGPRLGIALRVELEAEPPPGVAISLGAEQRPGLRESEVDVEENRFEL